MLKSILKVKGIQTLSKQQQLNIIGGEEGEGEPGGDTGVTCGVNTQCSDGSTPFWAPGCEPGCQVGRCQDGIMVTRPC
ncbi:MAG: hypothetical protein ACI9Y7_001619 [Dokdonia sp.]|jgi:hypothetical protein